MTTETETPPAATRTVAGAVAKREAGPVTIMWGRGKHFESILPGHVDVKGFLGTAAAALYASPDLMAAAERSPDSLITALMRCASLGHRPGTDEYYLIPRKVKGVATVQGIEGYRGIVERMYRSGAVASVVVREVCENDDFEYVEGIHDKPVHSVNWFGGGRGAMIGVYAYATLTTSAVSRVVILSRDDVHAARDASDSKDSSFSPWNRLDGGKDHPEFTGRAMWWKTAARRLEPWVPTSAEYRREQLRAAAAAADTPPPDIHEAEVVDA
jgi:recombination protein RecT